MNTQMMDNLFFETYMMTSTEITFAGICSWFKMNGKAIDDVTLFKALLFPEQLDPEQQAEFTRMIVYRHEEVFFQVNRADDPDCDDIAPHRDVSDPVHQLLLRLMNTRSLHGGEDALIDLGVALHQDMKKDNPRYPTLHSFVKQA